MFVSASNFSSEQHRPLAYTPPAHPSTTGTTERKMSTSPDTFVDASTNQWESKIERLSSNALAYKEISLESRLEILDEIISNLQNNPAILMKGNWCEHDLAVIKLGPIPSDSPGESIKYPRNLKDFLAFNRFSAVYVVVTTLQHIKKSLEYQIAMGKGLKNVIKPPLLAKVSNERIAGRNLRLHGPVEVFPIFHKLEVWADADASTVSDDNVADIESSSSSDTNGITVVLGAGNQSAITILDTICALFTYPLKPVFVKHHPLRPHLFELFSELFSPLIKRGLLAQIVDGGIPETKAIIQRPEVTHVHLTGALSTAQAVEATLAEARPHLTQDEIQKMVISELGCVTPFILAPGHYTKRELRMAAKHIVMGKKWNAGCNCVCSQAVILPSGWKQKDQFKSLLMKQFQATSTDPLYYPGSCELVKDITNHYANDRVTQVPGRETKRTIDGDSTDFLHPYIIDCGTYGETEYNDYALKNEAFGPALAIMELPGRDDDSMYLLSTAVPFVNDKDNIFGSLSCCLIYPKKLDKKIIKEVTGALNYGCVALNTWSAYGYSAIGHGGMWGGSKFEPLGQSGKGFIGNAFKIPNAEKSVISSRSLTFPLILDKNFVPPAVLTDCVTAVYLAKSPLLAIGAAFATLFRPLTSCFR